MYQSMLRTTPIYAQSRHHLAGLIRAIMIDAIIFDIDGTLVDSVDLHASAWQEAFAHFGFEIGHDAIRSQIGKGGDQLMPVFLKKEEVKRIGKDLDAFRGDLFKRKYMPKVQAFPGVRALFEIVRANGQRAALASSAKKDELATYKKIAQIEDLVREETSSDDAEKSKPYPDIFEAALDRLGNPDKDKVIVIGDSPHDAEAAKNAGLRIVGVLCGGFPANSLREAGCTLIFKDPEDITRNYAEILANHGNRR
jgi:HAD superfamily hydrolase (TIGR01549 family)